MESVPILSNDHGQENSSAPLVPEMEEIGFQRTGYLALRPATTRYEALAGPIAAIIGGKPPQTLVTHFGSRISAAVVASLLGDCCRSTGSCFHRAGSSLI